MQAITDNTCVHSQLNNKSITYDCDSSDFNPMLSYNSYSFQHILDLKSSYGYPTTQTIPLEYYRDNIVGFIPYVKKIRFCKYNNNNYYNSGTYYYVSNMIFYQIDLFEKICSPYPPIKIALAQQNSNYTEANCWYVDSIQRVGNKVVFIKTLQSEQGNTNIGFERIALVGNFDGHLSGTLPIDVKINDSNIFSEAVFENSWKKMEGQNVILNYQLTVGDEE